MLGIRWQQRHFRRRWSELPRAQLSVARINHQKIDLGPMPEGTEEVMQEQTEGAGGSDLVGVGGWCNGSRD